MIIDYNNFRRVHETVLHRFKDKRIYLLFSGGKDSSVCAHLLLEAGREFDFTFEAHAGAFPGHRYTASEKDRISTYWQQRGLPILWHDVGQDDACLVGIRVGDSLRNIWFSNGKHLDENFTTDPTLNEKLIPNLRDDRTGNGKQA